MQPPTFSKRKRKWKVSALGMLWAALGGICLLCVLTLLGLAWWIRASTMHLAERVDRTAADLHLLQFAVVRHPEAMAQIRAGMTIGEVIDSLGVDPHVTQSWHPDTRSARIAYTAGMWNRMPLVDLDNGPFEIPNLLYLTGEGRLVVCSDNMDRHQQYWWPATMEWNAYPQYPTVQSTDPAVAVVGIGATWGAIGSAGLLVLIWLVRLWRCSRVDRPLGVPVRRSGQSVARIAPRRRRLRLALAKMRSTPWQVPVLLLAPTALLVMVWATSIVCVSPITDLDTAPWPAADEVRGSDWSYPPTRWTSNLWVTSCDSSPDGRFQVFADPLMVADQEEPSFNRQLDDAFDRATPGYLDVAIADDGNMVVAAFDAGIDWHYGVRFGLSGRGTFPAVASRGLRCVDLSASGKWLLTGQTNGVARLWRVERNPDTGLLELTPITDLPMPGVTIQEVAFSPDERRVVVGGLHLARIWHLDPAAGSCSDPSDIPLRGDMPDSAFSPDSRWLALPDGDGWCLVELAIAGPAAWTRVDCGHRVSSLAFAPGGNLLAAAFSPLPDGGPRTLYSESPALVWELEPATRSPGRVWRCGSHPFVHSLVFSGARTLLVDGRLEFAIPGGN